MIRTSETSPFDIIWPAQFEAVLAAVEPVMRERIGAKYAAAQTAPLVLGNIDLLLTVEEFGALDDAWTEAVR
jgi:hypothetical protein